MRFLQSKFFQNGLFASFVSAFVLIGLVSVFESFQTSTRVAYSKTEPLTKILSAQEEQGAIVNASYSAVTQLSDTVKAQKSVVATNFTTQKGDELLVLVNKSIGLSPNYVPNDLVSLDPNIQTNSGARMRKEAADQLQAMFSAAKEVGHTLFVTSAYRSYYEQIVTYNYWVKVSGLAAANSFSAKAGHSQHQLGTAADLSSASVGYKLTQSFGETSEGQWLSANSWKYGYILSYPQGKEAITGYSFEPWHFRYIGISAASKLNSLNLDLETFLQKYGVW